MNEPNQPSQHLLLLSNGTPFDPNLINPSLGAGQVGLFTEFPQLSVALGKSVTTAVVVFKQSVSAQRLILLVEDVPTSWLESLPLVLQVAPGGTLGGLTQESGANAGALHSPARRRELE